MVTVEISREEYESLLRDSAFLQELEADGVDNWEGYSLAWEMFEEDFPEYKEK